jgi:hypothetical protein
LGCGRFATPVKTGNKRGGLVTVVLKGHTLSTILIAPIPSQGKGSSPRRAGRYETRG